MFLSEIFILKTGEISKQPVQTAPKVTLIHSNSDN